MPFSTDFPLSYGQRLRRIMQDNHLTISDLSRKLGLHSTTQLTRILNDEVSPALLTKFHSQFMLIFDWLISPAQIRALSTSLQYSCMGQDAFLTHRAMYSLLFEPQQVKAENILLRHASTHHSTSRTLCELIKQSAEYQQIDLLILGSSFDRLLPLFSSLASSGYPVDHLRIRHYFVMEENAAQLISQISALVPFLNESAYIGAYCTQNAPQAARFIRQNPIALFRTVLHDGSVATTVFLSPQEDGLPVCKLAGDQLYLFYDGLIAGYQDQMLPIKSVYPKPKTVESLLTLCQRDLFLEQNHACCFVKLDLCFQALPTEIALHAVDHGERMGMTMDDPLLQGMIRVHDARHQNLFAKKEPSILILTRQALTDFAKTGHMSDHLYAMRDFTPDERRTVLHGLLDALRQNEALSLHFIRDDALMPVGCFCAYEDLGIQIAANHTAYNMEGSHSEVFVGLPAFAHSFIHYCQHTLIPESCMTREESIAWLAQLAENIESL